MRSIRFRKSDWIVAVRVAPIAALTAGVKFAADQLGWDTVPLTTLHSGLLAANIFLMGFLLAGTLADYKESEKLPGELAGRTETIADECQILYRDKQAEPALRCLENLGRFADDVKAWLQGRTGVESPLQRLEELNTFFLAFEPLTQPNFIVRLKQEQSALRLLVIRINTIKETSFVGAGYVIAQMTSALLVIALIFADIAQLGAEMFLLAGIAFLFAYIILLIRDLDDPFDYDENGKRGSVEVSLQPLDYLSNKMAKEARSLAAGSQER